MKIVIAVSANETIVGISATLAAIGEQVILWDITKKPALDMFDEVKPDVLLIESIAIQNDPTIRMGLEENPITQLVLFGVSAPINTKPAVICLPNQLTPAQVKLVHTADCPGIQLPAAANMAQFYNGKYNERYASECLFISDLAPEALGQTIAILSDITQNFRTRIVGPHRLPLAEYCGYVSIPLLCDVMKSTTVGIDFNNKHIYDYAINKICCLSSVENTIVPTITKDLDIKEFVQSKKIRDKHVKAAYNIVREKHTYFHRTAELFQAFGHDEIGKLCIDKLNKVLDE